MNTLVMILLFIVGMFVGYELGRAVVKNELMTIINEFTKKLVASSNGRKVDETTDIQAHEKQ